MLDKRVLILGANGMLGKDMVKAFYENGFRNIYYSISKSNVYCENTFTFAKKIYLNVDKNINLNLKKLSNYKFDILINCIGIVKPRIIENNPESTYNAILVNSIFPNLLSKFFSKAMIFQIATDCVFSGKKGRYNEDSIHDPEDVYGKTKSLGEISSEKFFNIRCSIIGREIKNKYSLVEWFLSQKNNKLDGFINHKWNGVSTFVFSNILCAIIKQKINIPNTLHLIPKNIVNKYTLLKLLNFKFKNNNIIKSYTPKNKIDRTLDTKYLKLNDLIWKKSIFKRRLTIKEIVNLL